MPTADIHDDTKADLDATLKGLQLSNQEVDKFTKAFKDPEFMKLFEDYAREVSDPKVKQETDLYLRQLEEEGRGEDVYGQGVMLIVPTEAFLIKTHENGTNTKAYVNICTSDKLNKLSMRMGTGPNGQRGQQVDLPFSLSQKKSAQAKDGSPFLVWDMVVHPETAHQAKNNPMMKKLLVETAIENIKAAHKVDLSLEFKSLKATYKGTPEAPKPHVLTVRTDNNSTGSQGGRVKPVGNSPAVAGMPDQAALPATGKHASSGNSGDNSSSSGRNGSGGTRSSFKFPSSKKENATSSALAPHQPGYKHASGEVTPQWELIHRGQVDLGECWGDAGRNLAATPSSYPTHLVLRVDLPGCKSAAGVELDVGSRLVSICLPGKFKLEAPLPFPVDDALGKAKFDKTTSKLEITLPTLPPPKPNKPAPTTIITEVNTAVAAGEQTSDALVGQGDGQSATHSQQNSITSTDMQGAAAETYATDECKRCEQQAEKETGAEVTQQAAVEGDTDQQAAEEEALSCAMTENQRRWAELHAKEAQNESASSAQTDDDTTACAPAVYNRQASSPDASDSDFRACEIWDGPQPGFVFKLGDLGLGYYRDVQPPAHVQQGNRQVSAQQQQATTQLQPRLQCNIADELD